MATRSPFKRSRLLGLACLSRIADRYAFVRGCVLHWPSLTSHCSCACSHVCLGIRTASRSGSCRLKEEYLPFVPESIPFLSELLEDPEQEVEKRAQELVKELESLTGESLEPYLKV